MIAVLANGPSLREMWDDERGKAYDLVVGVNTAGWLYRVDILAYFDKEIFMQWPDGRPAPASVITHAKMKVWAEAERIDPDFYNAPVSILPHGELLDPAVKNCNYTFPIALDEVRKMGDEDVHIYGFDCAINKADVAGKGGCRSITRWRRELPWVRHVWQPEWKTYSHLPRPILEYLRKERLPQDLYDILPLPEKGPTAVIGDAKRRTA